MGFAVVDVNMRGTGCSGGAFNYFEPLENLDAYDVIETIANQPWVLHHKVGMFGISYGGISQLFAAQLDPHGLAAIAPLSVLDATSTTLYPGGILNTGFAVPWGEERQHDAEPAGPENGEHWAYEQIQKGDTTCAANQDLHGEAPNLLETIKENALYNPPVANPLDPVTFVSKINVPTFMACQWEDEQTGGHCADLAEHFTGTKHKWFTFLERRPYRLAGSVYVRPPLRLLGSVRRAESSDQESGISACCSSDRLPVGVRHLQRHPAARPDPGSPDLREGEERVQDPPGDPCAVRQRRRDVAHRQHHARRPVPRIRTVLLLVPDTGHDRALVVPRTRRHAQRTAGCRRTGGSYTSDAAATPLTDYSSNTGPGGLWGNASRLGMELGAAENRVRRFVCLGAAEQPTRLRSAGARQPVGQIVHS